MKPLRQVSPNERYVYYFTPANVQPAGNWDWIGTVGVLIMHQSIPAAPSSPLPDFYGAFARLVSPVGGAFANFALPGGRAFANPGRGQPQAFDTHAVSYQNITTQRILLEKQADWLIC